MRLQFLNHFLRAIDALNIVSSQINRDFLLKVSSLGHVGESQQWVAIELIRSEVQSLELALSQQLRHHFFEALFRKLHILNGVG